MKFTIYYRGDLPSGNKGNRNAKQRIREKIAPQLADLWNQVPLKDLSAKFLNPKYELTAVREVRDQKFACIVNSKNYLVAGLDILFLRPEEPGSLLTQGGDIDNRIKTLLDALSIPKANQMLRTSNGYGSLMHCLLEDDNLITDPNVSVDRLLSPESEKEVLILISVNVSCTRALMSNLGFGL